MKRHSFEVDSDVTPKKKHPSEANRYSNNTFSVKPIHQFSKPTPFFRQPVEFGNFSLDGERKFHHDARQLRHYLPPARESRIHHDLTQGYKTCIEKDDDIKERLTHLLTWITKNKHKFGLNEQGQDKKDIDNSKTKLNTDFIAWRGHFTKFLCSPYENRDPWEMAVTKYNGTIYISEVETEKSKADRLSRSSRQREMCYWGYKFEDYMTTPINDSGRSESTSDIVNTNEAYCSIVRTRLNKHSILMGAEVDCCRKDSQKKPPLNYIELKTTRIMDNYRQEMNFSRFKLKKFWGQSFLAGVPEIIVGMRDDNGIVHDLRTYKTLDLPNLCKQYQNSWDGGICMNFLDCLLTWLKELVIVDDVNTVYMLHYDAPFEHISVNVTKDGSQRFLPDWYINDDKV